MRRRQRVWPDGWHEVLRGRRPLGGFGPCQVCALLTGSSHGRWECEGCGGHGHANNVEHAELLLVEHLGKCRG